MSHYAVLKLAPDAPSEVIRAAYRALAARNHPDRCGGEPAAVSRMQRVNEAYRVLSDPELRAAHDAALGSRASPTPAPRPIQPEAMHLQRALQPAVDAPAPPLPSAQKRWAVSQYLLHARL